MPRNVAPYGSWKSPITADLLASTYVGLDELRIDGKDLYWNELRPANKGRNVIVQRKPDGTLTDITPTGFSARTRVHEYGGGCYLVQNGTVYFSNYTDQRFYRQDPASDPRPLTPLVDMRYADSVFDQKRNRIISIREDHTLKTPQAVNTIVSLDPENESEGKILFSGNDFYSTPRLSPDGTKLAWLTWNHPNMPWDGTELWIADVKPDGSLGQAEKIAGGLDESIYQPEWSPDGELYFSSDRTGWWNLHRWHNSEVEPLYPMEAEFGLPQWGFGSHTFVFESQDRIVCAYTKNGLWNLASLNLRKKKLEPIETSISQIDRGNLATKNGHVFLIGGSATEPSSIVRIDLSSRETEILHRSREITVGKEYISIPNAIEFPTENGRTAFAFFYPPKNPEYEAPQGEKPPLLVVSHGGPTSASPSTLRYEIQYWTSRGIGVVDVNYGGSTGYGREYRKRLNDQWGIVDVQDCVNATRYLASRGQADAERLGIRGGSAGGYTTLCALAFTNTFKVGASYFGVSDLELLAKDTHKFESRYLDKLVGPYPERRDIYRARSPIDHVDGISSALILFQGLEDKVVPPDQSEKIFEAVKAKGLPVAYIAYDWEQHGFRRAENIKRSYEAELYFYSKIFRFNLSDPIEPVIIENLVSETKPAVSPIEITETL
ncbi:S9 family peptidase [Candidatus Bathyarchaeota archaeon]|nr:MAG: S9 family peptidase [Candidatus Bathyarchaeota archaeon]TMI34873.1 MAG: S9 family peptidase [Candidatus Bathyarchaeota archaeon]TMI59902.1 MAG: S9 family peptidase [Candidatus Bathyarchaeota archaeon]